MVIVRKEHAEDADAIRRVLTSAFETSAEARLVDELRARNAFELSLVAEVDGQIVGHILFTRVSIGSEHSATRAVAIGPMGVVPQFQRKGIGSQLVLQGLEECRRSGGEVVIVLGHPGFYPRFGFSEAKPYGIRFEDEVPDEAFMVAELRPGALSRVHGIVRYEPEFTTV